MRGSAHAFSDTSTEAESDVSEKRKRIISDKTKIGYLCAKA